MFKKVIYSLITLLATLALSGCLGCMLRGVDSQTCSRIKLNAGVHERREEVKNIFEKSIQLGHTTPITKQQATEEVGLWCERHNKYALAKNPYTDPNVRLGSYFGKRFCNLLQSDKPYVAHKIVMIQFEVDYRLYIILTDGKRPLEWMSYTNAPTENSYKYEL